LKGIIQIIGEENERNTYVACHGYSSLNNTFDQILKTGQSISYHTFPTSAPAKYLVEDSQAACEHGHFDKKWYSRDIWRELPKLGLELGVHDEDSKLCAFGITLGLWK
jgi:hypothetical protein